MWILSYARIAILVGIVLAAGNVSLRFMRRELPVLVGGSGGSGGSGGVGMVEGKEERIVGLEVLEGRVRGVIEEEERRERVV